MKNITDEQKIYETMGADPGGGSADPGWSPVRFGGACGERNGAGDRIGLRGRYALRREILHRGHSGGRLLRRGRQLSGGRVSQRQSRP